MNLEAEEHCVVLEVWEYNIWNAFAYVVVAYGYLLMIIIVFHAYIVVYHFNALCMYLYVMYNVCSQKIYIGN